MKRTLSKIGQMELRNPWTWPIIVMVVLIVIVLVGTMLAIFAGCAASGGYSGGGSSNPGTVANSTSNGDFTEHTLTLSDGRTVTCLTWGSWDYLNDAMKSGVDCLEPEAE